MATNEFAPITPGEMLKEEFLAAYDLIRKNQLAKAIGISPNRIAEIVNNRRRITADTALRLSLYFGNSAEFWMNLQSHYDLKMARRNLKSVDVAQRPRQDIQGKPRRLNCVRTRRTDSWHSPCDPAAAVTRHSPCPHAASPAGVAAARTHPAGACVSLLHDVLCDTKSIGAAIIP